jgi:hypothetical protein
VQEVRRAIPGIYARAGSVGLEARTWFAILRRDLPQVQEDYRVGEAMKAKPCDECRHATIKRYLYKGPPEFEVLTCAKKHKPRFYMPRHDNPLDLNWGWKRACADFETANA